MDSTTLSVDSTIVKDTAGVVKNADSSLNVVTQLEPPSILEVISVGKVIWAIIFFIVGLYVIRLITKVLEIFAERSTRYRITIKSIAPVIRIFGWMLIIHCYCRNIPSSGCNCNCCHCIGRYCCRICRAGYFKEYFRRNNDPV